MLVFESLIHKQKAKITTETVGSDILHSHCIAADTKSEDAVAGRYFWSSVVQYSNIKHSQSEQTVQVLRAPNTFLNSLSHLSLCLLKSFDFPSLVMKF